MFKYKYYRKRIVELDFLRGIAILLVLCSHYHVTEAFKTMWMGVDLFFVLSGFLISGLLIKEYQRTNKLNIKRFLIRRGLKIYFSFYFFLFFSVGIILLIRKLGIPVTRVDITWQAFLFEMVYLQNYCDNIWGHDWSLAVEEHFYFFLAAFFFLFRNSKNLIKRLFVLALISLPIVLVLRILFIDHSPAYEQGWAIYATHLRIDSLFAGVIISCIYHTSYDYLRKRSAAFWFSILTLGILIIAAWLSVFSKFTAPAVKYGYTVIYVGYSMILLGFVMIKDYDIRWWNYLFSRSAPINIVAMIGVYSYNIYLWHIFSLDTLYAVLIASIKADILNPLAWRWFMGYILLSIFLGIITAKLIEIPVLKWRDKKYT